MTATKTKAPKEKLTLRDDVDLYAALNAWIEDHVDELELNGGALPDDLASMMDEIQASTAERVDAFKFKLDEFAGKAFTAKAVKDGAARREKVWNNVIASMKAYGLNQVLRTADGRLEGNVHVMRTQRNGQPSTELTAPPESHNDILLSIFDGAATAAAKESADFEAGARDDINVYTTHPLARFITVQRVATLDKKALAAAYLARQQQLVDETPLLGESDIPDEIMAGLNGSDSPAHPDDIAGVLEEMRRTYIADNLAVEFPGVAVVRGVHLRID